MSHLDLIYREFSQHFTLCVPVDAEVFDLQLLLPEELLDLQIEKEREYLLSSNQK